MKNLIIFFYLGKPAGIAMQRLKDIWIEKDFEPSAQELLEKLPEVLENVNVVLPKPKSRENVKNK